MKQKPVDKQSEVALLERSRFRLGSVRSLVLFLQIMKTGQRDYIMGFLAYEINKSRNNPQEDNGVHDIFTSPHEAVCQIFFNTIMLLNPDILAHRGLSEVATADPHH